jgi:hypothetical protein
MKITKYRNTYIISIFGKIFFTPQIILPNIKRIFRRIFLTYSNDSDCDGFSETWKDKLTDGKIYYAHGWSYTRVGGGFGYKVEWFNF